MTMICIDPGHGGEDRGAVNGNYFEADATLILGKKVTNRLRNAGYRVVMTRNTDKTLSLQKRCDISDDYNADLFVSIHVNSATNKEAQGIETWKSTVVQSLTYKLADNVQRALIKATDAKDRGVKSQAFYVLKNTNAPAILIEVGFISNAQEVKKIFDTDYQNKLADAIVKGIMDTLKP